MKNKIGSLLATAIGMILLIYSAYRSYDFVALTLPPDKQIIAFFALAALDGGLIAWLLSYLYGSHGAWQRTIALLMVMVDFLGAVTMFSLDTIYNAGKTGLIASMDPNTMRSAMLALSAVIAINIGATVAHHMLDPQALRRQAEEDARAEIEEQSLAIIRKNSQTLAAEIAPQVATAWRDNVVTEYGHRLRRARAAKTLPVILEELPAQPEELPATNPTKHRRSKS